MLANLLEEAAHRCSADVEVLEAVNVESSAGERPPPTSPWWTAASLTPTLCATRPRGTAGGRNRLARLPGTDRAIRPDLYAKAGIAAYWLVTLRELLADTARMRQPSQAHCVPHGVGRRLRIGDNIGRHRVCGDQLPRLWGASSFLPHFLRWR